MSQLLNRKIEVLCNGRKWIYPDLNITFTVPFTSGSIVVYNTPGGSNNIPDESDISIFNLSDDSINKFISGQSLILNAGYGDSIGTILNGVVENAILDRSSSVVDRELKIKVIEATSQYYYKKISKTYAANSTSKSIIRDVLGSVGIIPNVLVLSDPQVYQLGFNAQGTILEVIKRLVNDSNSRIITRDSSISIVPAWDGRNYLGDNDIGYVVSADTGLISITPINDNTTPAKWDVKMLLNHAVSVYSIIQIKSQVFNGMAIVCDGSHSCDGPTGTFITEVQVMPL
jgi:hypothetical protein